MGLKFRESEVGRIPTDWNTKKLVQLAEIATGTTPPTNDSSNYGNEYLFVSPIDLGKGKWVFDTEKKLSKKGFSIARRFPKGSILFTCIGSTIGKAGMAPIELTSNQQINAIFPNDKYISDYIYYSLNLIAPNIKALAGEQAVPLINKTQFGETYVALPPTEAEQTAIATALSDTDALITSLEKLIAKKRNIKQGAMQELLKPKNGWKSYALEEIVDKKDKWSFTGGPFGSNLKFSDYTNKGVRVIQLQNIGDGNFINDSEVYTSLTKANELISCNIYPGEIILSKMGDPVARGCFVPNFADRFLMCSDGIRVSVDKSRFNAFFILESINSKSFRAEAESASTGSTRKRIGLSQLRKLRIACPSLPEQDSIAKLFLSMKTEIEALETKLRKLQKVKVSMMQALLTGQIRLV